jgi:uncharacterized protein YggE
MKTRSSKLLALSLAMIAFGGLQSGVAQAADRYIAVSASGTVKVKPDTVRLNATVSVVNATNKDALAGASASAAKVRAALLANGITAQYIKSTSLTVFPEYNYTADKGSVLTGYRASQSFEIIIRNAANAGVIVDAVVASTDNSLSIDGVTPFVYDNTIASQSARTAAVKSAKSKALSYAKLLGVSLGKIVSLEESTASNPYPVMMAMAKSDAGATQIDLGQQDLTISITTRWAL